jgi:hypothetical protein
MSRLNRRFQPSLDGLELRVSLSALAVAASVAKIDDPEPLPDPEPPPPPNPGPEPPLPWPPIAPNGPVGPGVALDTLMPGGGHMAPIILGPVTPPGSILA